MARTVSGLYAVTPEIADTAILSDKVEAALRGGARVIQYRNKSADELLRNLQARAISQLCRRAGACFIVNDSVSLAREVEADGVHLGSCDEDLDSARRVLGPGKLIGVSCYAQLSRARESAASGADYVAFGSFFASPTKPGAVRADMELLAAARLEISIPIVAIGGITADNGADLIACGADALAVVTALFDSADVEQAARQFAALFMLQRSS
jgi:thiamine-phosphate pyrophosphorylase